MSSAAERHTRHEGTFGDHETRISDLETTSAKEITWRTGEETPRLGAEDRIHRLEKGALMIADMDQLVSKAVSKYLRSVRGVLAAALPWVVFVVGVILYVISGHAPPALPSSLP